MLEPAALSINEIAFARVLNSFNMDEITLGDLELHETGENERVICLTPHELLTSEKIIPFQNHPGTAPGVDVENQIVKLAVF